MRRSAVIPVPPEAVWDFVAEIRNAPRWMFGVTEVTGEFSDPVVEGDRVRIRLGAGGRSLESEWMIGACQRPRLFSSSGRAMGANAELRLECRALGESATEVVQELSYQLPKGMLGLLASRLGVEEILLKQAQMSLEALAAQLAPSSPREPASPATGERLDGSATAFD